MYPIQANAKMYGHQGRVIMPSRSLGNGAMKSGCGRNGMGTKCPDQYDANRI